MKFLYIRPTHSNNNDSILFKIDGSISERNSITMLITNATVINYTNTLTCRWYIDNNYLYRHLQCLNNDRKEIGDLSIGTTLKSMKISITAYYIDILDIDDKELSDNIISLNLRT